MNKTIVILLALILAACSNGTSPSTSDEPNAVPVFVNNYNDNNKPYITAPTQAIATNEGATTVTSVIAKDPNNDVVLTYKLEGNSTSSTDYAAFQISTAGVITYKIAPIYIAKKSYSFTVVVSDQFDSAKKDINVTVNIPPFAWVTSTPELEGMDATKLQAAIDYTFTDDFNTQGLIIIRKGKVVTEKYEGMSDAVITGLKRVYDTNNYAAGGFGTGWDDAKYQTEFGTRNEDSIGISNSGAKTILSSLIGIAVDNGAISSLDNKVSQYITSWVGTTKENITLKDIITMRSGLFVQPDAAGLLGGMSLYYESDQLAVSLGRGLSASPPVNKFVYSGMADSLILGEVLRIATGKTALEYGKDNLFTQMDLSNYDWWRDAAGTVLVWGNFDSTLRDYAKFGLLWSHDVGLEETYGANVIGNGKWEGEQLVSSSWLAAAREPAVVTTFADYIYYGYHMYKATKLVSPATLDNNELTVDIFSAKGFNDNSIWWIPEYDLVVARHGLYTPILNDGNEKVVKGDISGNPALTNKDSSNYIGNVLFGSLVNTSAGFKPYNANYSSTITPSIAGSYITLNDEHMLKKIIEAVN
jgi:CubicO group peptidase (beta-lactamase class C family)